MNLAMGEAILRLAFWLALLVGGLLFVAWAARRLGVAGRARGGENAIRVLSRTALDPRKSLLVVSVRGRSFLIGVTPSEVRLLSEVSDETDLEKAAEADAVALAAPPVAKRPLFAARLARALRSAGDVGAAH